MMLILVLAQLVTLAGSMPTVSPTKCWETPCSSGVVTLQHMTIKINITKFYENLRLKAGDVVIKSNYMKSLYIVPIGNRITSPELISYLPSVEYPGFPDMEEENLSGNITETFLRDYEKISTVAIFWDEMIKGEDEDNLIKNNMTEISSKLCSMLCDIDTALHIVFNSRVENYVKVEDVIDDKFHLSNRQERYIRDYVIFQDTNKGFDTLREKYNGMINSGN